MIHFDAVPLSVADYFLRFAKAREENLTPSSTEISIHSSICFLYLALSRIVKFTPNGLEVSDLIETQTFAEVVTIQVRERKWVAPRQTRLLRTRQPASSGLLPGYIGPFTIGIFAPVSARSRRVVTESGAAELEKERRMQLARKDRRILDDCSPRRGGRGGGRRDFCFLRRRLLLDSVSYSEGKREPPPNCLSQRRAHLTVEPPAWPCVVRP